MSSQSISPEKMNQISERINKQDSNFREHEEDIRDSLMRSNFTGGVASSYNDLPFNNT